MTAEIKGSWADWQPSPESVGKERDDVYVHVFVPYSDLQWSSSEQAQQDFKAIETGKNPPGLRSNDPDYYMKDKNGNYMPGNIMAPIYWDIPDLLPYSRLMHIKQLALLTYSAESERNYYGRGYGFTQTRDNHSFTTALALEKMLIENNFPKTIVNNGIIAAMSHDIATPPWGDPTKEIDPEILNEEVAVKRIFDKYDLSKLTELYGFDQELVLGAIQGQGTLGKLLDIADKLSYTAIDVYNYIGPTSDTVPYERRRDISAMSKIVEPMRKLVYENPQWANVYHDVKVDEEGTPYFADVKNLSTFLELRARMHKGLYLNAHCRGQDMLYKILIKPLYSRNPHPDFPFNSENLLCMGDEEADRIIVKYWNFLSEDRALNSHLGILPDYVKVKHQENIGEEIEKLQQQGLLIIGSETIRKFGTATSFRAIDPVDGQIKPFSEILPEKTVELAQMAEYANQTVVYYWPESTDKKSREFELKPTIAQIIEDAKQRNGGKLPNYSLYN